MLEHECKQETEIKLMHKKIDSIAKDVRSLLQFKWQIIGGSVVVAFITTTVIALLK